MTNKEKILAFRNDDDEELIFFECPSYDEAIIGVSADDRVCYMFDKMIECLVKEQGMTPSESIEFIDVNTLCFSEKGGKYPVIIYDIPSI